MALALVENFYPRNTSVHPGIMIESRDEENSVLDTKNVQELLGTIRMCM